MSGLTVLGLDPSLCSTGSCAFVEPDFKTSKFGNFKTSIGTLFDRILAVECWIKELIFQEKPDIIAIEAFVPAAQMSAMLSPIFFFALKSAKEYAMQNSCFVVCPQNTAVKKLAVGRGLKVKKSEMVAAAKRELGFQGRLIADCADAFFIARLAWRFYLFAMQSGVHNFTPEELQIFGSEELNHAGQKKGLVFRPGEMFFDWRSLCHYRMAKRKH